MNLIVSVLNATPQNLPENIPTPPSFVSVTFTKIGEGAGFAKGIIDFSSLTDLEKEKFESFISLLASKIN